MKSIKTMKKKLIYNLVLASIASCISIFFVGVAAYVCIPVNLIGFTFKAMYDQIKEQGEEIQILKEIIKK